jgi:hypothetical protein
MLGISAGSSRGCVDLSRGCVDLSRTLDLLTEDERERFTALFRAIDADGSGAVTLEEIHASRKLLRTVTELVNSKVFLEDLLATVDENSDGELSREEFLVFMRMLETGAAVFAPGRGGPVGLREMDLRERVRVTLEEPGSSELARALNVAQLVIVFLSVASLCLETLPHLSSPAFYYVELGTTVVFTADYAARLALTRQRWRFVTRPMNVVDLLAILPTFVMLALGGLGGGSRVLSVARALRIVRLFKLSRGNSWLLLYVRALHSARVPLLMAGVIVLVDVLAFSLLLFYAERGRVDPLFEHYWDDSLGRLAMFQSVPDTIYFSVVSITTVGYGDLYPLTTLGRVIGGIALVAGILCFAIPVSVFSTQFFSEYQDVIQERCRAELRRRELQRSAQSARLKRHFCNRPSLIAERETAQARAQARAQAQAAPPSWSRRCCGDGGCGAALGPAAVAPAPDPHRFDPAAFDDLEPALALAKGLQALDENRVTSMAERQRVRHDHLQAQMLRVVDRRREMLFVDMRHVRRKYSSKVLKGVIERYATWFMATEAEIERDVVKSVVRIQAVYRGGVARVNIAKGLVSSLMQVKKEANDRTNNGGSSGSQRPHRLTAQQELDAQNGWASSHAPVRRPPSKDTNKAQQPQAPQAYVETKLFQNGALLDV